MTDPSPDPDFPRITSSDWDSEQQRGGAAAYVVLAWLAAAAYGLLYGAARVVLGVGR